MIKTSFLNLFSDVRNTDANKSVFPCRNISFCGLQKDTLELSSKDLLKLDKCEIFNKVNNAINRENFLGAGGEACVFSIPDTPYCVRLIKKRNACFDTVDKSSFKKFDNKFSLKLTEDDKVNHIVAKLGGGATIMKKIEGYPLVLYNPQNFDKTQKEVNDAFYKLSPLAFNCLLKQVYNAKMNGFIFDCSSSNVIMNPKQDKLTAIDFYKASKDYPEDVNVLRRVYASFVKEAEFERKHCAGYLLKSALMELQPNVKSEVPPNEFKFLDFINKVKLESEDEFPTQIDILSNVLVHIQCLKFRELIGEDVTKDLLGQHKVANALINQLFLT